MKTHKEILHQLGFTIDGSQHNKLLFENIIRQAMDDYAIQYHEWKVSKIKPLNTQDKECKHEFVAREYFGQPNGTCIECGAMIL